MKPKIMTVTGRTLSGKTGTRYVHNLRSGMRVKTPEGLEGEIVGKGIAGMPEVQFADGSTTYEYPESLEILEANSVYSPVGISESHFPAAGGFAR